MKSCACKWQRSFWLLVSNFLKIFYYDIIENLKVLRMRQKNSHISFFQIPYMLTFLFCSLLSKYIYIFPPEQLELFVDMMLLCLSTLVCISQTQDIMIKIRKLRMAMVFLLCYLDQHGMCFLAALPLVFYSCVFLPSELVLKWVESYHFALQKAFTVLSFIQNYVQTDLHAIHGPFLSFQHSLVKFIRTVVVIAYSFYSTLQCFQIIDIGTVSIWL